MEKVDKTDNRIHRYIILVMTPLLFCPLSVFAGWGVK